MSKKNAADATARNIRHSNAVNEDQATRIATLGHALAALEGRIAKLEERARTPTGEIAGRLEKRVDELEARVGGEATVAPPNPARLHGK